MPEYFAFVNIDGVIVFPDFTVFALDRQEIEAIAAHTEQTWQPDRDVNETLANTTQGKIAENIVDYYLNQVLHITYEPYDLFRQNNFEKHAPFDGVIYSPTISEETKNSFKDRIVKEVAMDEWGRISERLKKELEDNKIYRTEIKSTKVRPAHKTNGNQDQAIIQQIKILDDYMTYPYYCRSSSSIRNTQDYQNHVVKRYKISSPHPLREIERNHMCMFYIRVYLDYVSKKAYIIGFITKDNFFPSADTLPLLKRMPQFKKSERAIYFARSLNDGHPIDTLRNYI